MSTFTPLATGRRRGTTPGDPGLSAVSIGLGQPHGVDSSNLGPLESLPLSTIRRPRRHSRSALGLSSAAIDSAGRGTGHSFGRGTGVVDLSGHASFLEGDTGSAPGTSLSSTAAAARRHPLSRDDVHMHHDDDHRHHGHRHGHGQTNLRQVPAHYSTANSESSVARGVARGAHTHTGPGLGDGRSHGHGNVPRQLTLGPSLGLGFAARIPGPSLSAHPVPQSTGSSQTLAVANGARGPDSSEFERGSARATPTHMPTAAAAAAGATVAGARGHVSPTWSAVRSLGPASSSAGMLSGAMRLHEQRQHDREAGAASAVGASYLPSQHSGAMAIDADPRDVSASLEHMRHGIQAVLSSHSAHTPDGRSISATLATAASGAAAGVAHTPPPGSGEGSDPGAHAPDGATPTRSRKRPRTSIDPDLAEDVPADCLTIPNTSVGGEAVALREQIGELRLLRERDAEEHALELKGVHSELGKANRRLRFMVQEEEACRTKLRQEEKKNLSMRHLHQTELQKARQAERSALQKLEETKDQMHGLRAELQSVRQQDFKHSRERFQALRQQVQELQTQLAKCEHAAGQLPSMQARAEAAEAKLRATPPTSQLETTIKQLQHRLSQSETQRQAATSEARQLRGGHDSVTLMQEQIAAARAKATRLEAAALAGNRAQAELKVAKQDAARWDSMFRELLEELGKRNSRRPSEPDTPLRVTRVTPEDVMSVLRDMQREQAALLQAQGSAELSATTSRRAAAEANKRVAELDSELATAQERVLAAESALIRAERKAAWVARERDSLKSLVDSFTSETAMRDGNGVDEEARRVVAAQAKRIKALEAEVLEAKNQAKTATTEAASATPSAVHAKATERIRGLERQLDGARKESDKLAAQLERVERDAAYLQAQVAKGDFRRSTTKVLHLSLNPTKVALSEKAAARTKLVERLTARVLELEREAADVRAAGDGDTSMPAGRAAAVPVGREADLEKKIVRLKEAFREKITAFREAIYLLTGYKVDMSSGTGGSGAKSAGRAGAQLRLRSMYAEQEDDVLLFQMKPAKKGSADAGLELLETDLTSRIDAKLFTYLTAANSIPAFLSTLTLDLFERQTYVG